MIPTLIIGTRRHSMRVVFCVRTRQINVLIKPTTTRIVFTLVCEPATRAHVFIKSTTRIATNDDSLVDRCASASSRRKFNADSLVDRCASASSRRKFNADLP